MSYFNIVCDVCGREVRGYTWNNGMKFCAKCHQETFGNNTSKFVDLLHTEMYELKISNLEHKLNEKDQRISELEEQLNNSVRPKFKIGQEVFIIFETTEKKHIVESTKIDSITIFAGNELSYYCKYVDGERMYLELDEDELFATKAEALEKLEELKGE